MEEGAKLREQDAKVDKKDKKDKKGGNMEEDKDEKPVFVPDPMGISMHIPPLGDGERIEDWEPLFTAAVSPLLAKGPAGHKLAIGMLPAHVNRRRAERELIREIVTDKKTETLSEAFSVLKDALDPPIDKYKAMQDLCRMDWSPGVMIDDYYYSLKRLGHFAGAQSEMICSLLVSQLPKEIQGKAKAWIADHEDDLSDKAVRSLVSDIKQWLMDRGLALDRGARVFNDSPLFPTERVAAISIGVEDTAAPDGVGAAAVTGAPTPERQSSRPEERSECDEVMAVRARRGRGFDRFSQSTSRPPIKCYICSKTGHIMRSCPERCCPRCGKKGHDLRACKRVMRIECHNTSEEAVTLGVRFDDQPVSAMLDSGAGTSVMDKRTAELLGVLTKVCPVQGPGGKVYGVGGEVGVDGAVTVRVDVGTGDVRDQLFKVLDCTETVVILGRDFLSTFPSVEFDWERGRIRLGSHWKIPDLMVGGGQHAARVAVARMEERSDPDGEQDILM